MAFSALPSNALIRDKKLSTLVLVFYHLGKVKKAYFTDGEAHNYKVVINTCLGL